MDNEFSLDNAERVIVDRLFTSLSNPLRWDVTDEEARVLRKFMFIPEHTPDNSYTRLLISMPLFDIATGNALVSTFVNTLMVAFSQIFAYQAVARITALFDLSEFHPESIRLLCILILLAFNIDRYKNALLVAINSKHWVPETRNLYSLFSSLHSN